MVDSVFSFLQRQRVAVLEETFQLTARWRINMERSVQRTQCGLPGFHDQLLVPVLLTCFWMKGLC